MATIAQEFAEMKENLAVALDALAAQEAHITTLIAADEAPEDPMAALTEKMETQQATITTLGEEIAGFETEKANAVSAALAEQATQHEKKLTALSAQLATEQELTAALKRKLEDPAFALASLPGQDAVDAAATEESATEGPYAEYRAIKKADPLAATEFWRENEAAIKADLRIK